MYIRMYADNRINVAAGAAARTKPHAVQASAGAFEGAQCRVTISKEARRLSEQTRTARSAQSIKEEKIMLRQQEQSGQTGQLDELRNQYSNLLEEIKKCAKSTNNYYGSDEYKETIEKKQQALDEIHNQKQKQIEENQKNAKAAQQMAMQSFDMQDEIDENNRDLLVLLKSLEEAENAKEEKENGGSGAAEDGGSAKTENSVCGAIQNSAARFTVSSIKRELDTAAMIQALNDEGHYYLDRADEIERNAFAEADSIKNLFDDDNYTDDEKKNAVMRYGAKMIGADIDYSSDKLEGKAFEELKILVSDHSDAKKEEALSQYREKMSKFSDLAKYRNRGVQMIRDSKECKLKHIELNPLQGMEEAKSSMMQSAIAAAFNEASQGKLDEASQELEDAVNELIDERNDITHIKEEEEEKEDDEAEKEIGELLQIEEEDKIQDKNEYLKLFEEINSNKTKRR